eukprot:364323-Chlamydomonas_euryale.AAC.12
MLPWLVRITSRTKPGSGTCAYDTVFTLALLPVAAAAAATVVAAVLAVAAFVRAGEQQQRRSSNCALLAFLRSNTPSPRMHA